LNQTTGGWVVFIVALGMMCGLMANDVAKLTTWNGALAPSFIAILMSHFGAVVTAFIGGKMIPESRVNKLTRSDDKEKE
jgi:putative Mn2+ efflux pump MntP